jgi:hypothetical protein
MPYAANWEQQEKERIKVVMYVKNRCATKTWRYVDTVACIVTKHNSINFLFYYTAQSVVVFSSTDKFHKPSVAVECLAPLSRILDAPIRF